MSKIIVFNILALIGTLQTIASARPCSGIVIQLESKSLSSTNEEAMCPVRDGEEFLSINGFGISMYMDSDTARYCHNGENPQKMLVTGCISEHWFNKNGSNTFGFQISNVSDDTYVHVIETVTVNPGKKNQLYLWHGITRQGRGNDQVYSDKTTKRFSTIALRNGDGSNSATVREIIDETKDFAERFEDTRSELDDIERKLNKILEKPIDLIDVATLGPDIPIWFKTLITDIQRDLSDTKAKAEESLRLLNEQVAEFKAASEKVLADEGIDPSSISFKDSDFAELDDIDLNIDEISTYPEDNVFSRNAALVIEDLNNLLSSRNRVGFAERVYRWIAEKQALDKIMVERAGLVEGEWEAYLKAQQSVLNLIYEHMDQRLYFKSSNVPETVKDSLDETKAPQEIKKKLRDSLLSRDFDPNDRRTIELFDSINEIAKAYDYAVDHEARSGLGRIAEGLASVLKTGFEIVKDVATCVAKTTAAGPYADYYELRYQKGFCDGSELALWEVAVAGSSLGITVASAAAATPVGAAIIGAASRTFKTVLGIGVKVWKSTRALKAANIAEKILESAAKAFNAGSNTIGFTKGTGIVAFANKSRSQHAARHLTDAGILPNWSNATFEKFKEFGVNIVENPLKSFDHKLGQTAVRGFHGKVDGKDVVMFIYKEGKDVTQIATSVVPTPQQMINWGLN